MNSDVIKAYVDTMRTDEAIAKIRCAEAIYNFFKGDVDQAIQAVTNGYGLNAVEAEIITYWINTIGNDPKAYFGTNGFSQSL